MQRRIIAAVAAVLLAGIGTILLYTYVNTAEQRAMASMESIDVLVVTKAVPVGTSGADIAPYVELKKLPKVAVASGALTDTTSVTDLVTNSTLGVGEQVLATRFIQPDTTTNGTVEVPSDMQLVSIPVEAARAVGSSLTAGDKVGVYVTRTDKKSGDPVTALALRSALLVKVQGAGGSGDTSAAPSGTLILTFALKPADAARVVYAEENNKIWLALEPKDGGTGTVVVTPKTVLK